MPPQSPGPRLFAMYVEATKKRNDGEVSREQLIVTPPHITSAGPDQIMFYRSQETLRNRVKWQWRIATPAEIQVAVHSRIRRYDRGPFDPMWVMSPVITCQVHEKELEQLHANPQTPWRLIERFRRVARVKHSLNI